MLHIKKKSSHVSVAVSDTGLDSKVIIQAQQSNFE